MYRFLVVPIAFAVAACAASGAEPGPSEFAQTAESVPATEPSEETIARDDDMVADHPPAEDSSELQVLDSPEVSKISPSTIPGRPDPEPAVVCERVVPTGSILPVRVCRDKREIARKEAADREIFDDIKRNTALGNTRL